MYHRLSVCICMYTYMCIILICFLSGFMCISSGKMGPGERKGDMEHLGAFKEMSYISVSNKYTHPPTISGIYLFIYRLERILWLERKLTSMLRWYSSWSKVEFHKLIHIKFDRCKITYSYCMSMSDATIISWMVNRYQSAVHWNFQIRWKKVI